MIDTSRPSAKISTLESLRGLAAVAVVFHHTAQQTQGDALVHQAAGPILLWLGSWGVAVFFVLSGFCIHGSMLGKQPAGHLAPDWPDYFRRRATRILPGYWLALAISIGLGAVANSNIIAKARWVDIWTHLTFTSSFNQDTAPSINTVFWTVVVEAHFYLAYPLLLWLRNRIGIIWVTAGLLALSLCIKLGGLYWLDADARWMWHRSFLNLWWVWSLGALLAELQTADSLPKFWRNLFHRPLTVIVAITLSLLPGLFDSRSQSRLFQVVESYFLPLVAALVVLAVIRSPLPALKAGVLTHLGRVSYSMYLLHPVALWLVVWSMPAAPPALAIGVMTAGAWILAQAGYYGIERPFLSTRS